MAFLGVIQMKPRVTAAQVRAAAIAANITRVEHHDCSICRTSVHYTIANERLFFSPGCGCKWEPSEPRSWQDAADWINMQPDDEVAQKLAARFGIEPQKGV